MESSSASDERRPSFSAFIQTEITPGAAVTLLLCLQKSTSKCQPRPRRNVMQPPAEYGMRSSGSCPTVGVILGLLMRTDAAAAASCFLLPDVIKSAPVLMRYAFFYCTVFENVTSCFCLAELSLRAEFVGTTADQRRQKRRNNRCAFATPH